MPCNGFSGCGAGFLSDCPLPVPPSQVGCCGMKGSVSIRLPNCACCLPMCPPPEEPQCPPPCLCVPPPICSSDLGCSPPCQSSCGGPAPCCPRPAPCRPIVLLTQEFPKKKCTPIMKILDECPDPITWPDPPKVDMCCMSNCPIRTIDICYMKVCPDAPRCCPPNFPCGAKAAIGGCCNRR